MFWIKRHHVVAAVLASAALLLSVILVGEPLNRHRVEAGTVSVSVVPGGLAAQQRLETISRTRTHIASIEYVLATPTQVGDGRGTGEGWYMTISQTGLRALGTKVAVPYYYMSVEPQPDVRTITGSSPPAAYGGVIDGRGLTLVRAAEGAGMGLFEITPMLDISAPKDTPAGAVLETTVVQTLVSAH